MLMPNTFVIREIQVRMQNWGIVHPICRSCCSTRRRPAALNAIKMNDKNIIDDDDDDDDDNDDDDDDWCFTASFVHVVG